MDKKAVSPKVFISSTVEDLEFFRTKARDAAISVGFMPKMMEYFAAQGENPPLDDCLRHIDECDLLVVIVANRYGWIPPGQPDGEIKSITWLECLHAAAQKKEVIAFILDPKKKDWPLEFNEEYLVAKAIQDGSATPDLFQQTQRTVKKLKEFKKWLDSRGVRANFVNPDDLRGKVYQSLIEWREKHADRFHHVRAQADPQLYLEWLREENGYIDIRGLQVGAGKASRFGIEELYIPLTTISRGDESKRSRDNEERAESRKVELHEVLQSPQVAIIGEPGAGKTTFIKRIAFALCQTLQGIEPAAAETRLGLKTPYFPIFIRLFELVQHIASCEKRKSDHPTLAADPQWLVHFLREKSRSQNWKLDEDFWQEKLSSDQVILLLDGLDEAPDRGERERIAELISQAVKTYRKARFVITSRPRAYVGKAVLQEFPQAHIESLEPEAIDFYLQRWTKAAYFDAPRKADEHYQELQRALHDRLEIRKLARNPVMLTALAVVHWNEKRLPEQRADLYDSIITWLLRSREQRPGRLGSDQCAERLQQLALNMQSDNRGRHVQIGRRLAAEAIQNYFKGKNEERRIAAADQFLAEEEVDSGVIVGRGNELVFWHLTFLEYLCAKALAGKTDDQQKSILVRKEILHSPDWREVLLLYVGVLYRQGRDKTDAFFSRILDLAARSSSLADEARCVGLIGAMLRDLQPFHYQLVDDRYDKLLERIKAIFDKDKAMTIPLESRLEAAEALGQAGDPRLQEDNMVLIPGGEFHMGARKTDKKGRNYDQNAWLDESPVHKVTLSPYRIGRFPVTVEEYARFIADDGYDKKKYWRAGGFKKFTEPDKWEAQRDFPNRPVVGVSWYEAMAYAQWAGQRLPTEAQWERAARGSSDVYHAFPWGDELPDGKNTHSHHNNIGRPAPVGLFPCDCTDEDILDMGGNVREWCLDWKDCAPTETSMFYSRSEGSKDPCNDERAFVKIRDDSCRVVRGGSWDSNYEIYFRCAYRSDNNPVNRGNYLGFRVVASPQLF